MNVSVFISLGWIRLVWWQYVIGRLCPDLRALHYPVLLVWQHNALIILFQFQLSLICDSVSHTSTFNERYTLLLHKYLLWLLITFVDFIKLDFILIGQNAKKNMVSFHIAFYIDIVDSWNIQSSVSSHLKCLLLEKRYCFWFVCGFNAWLSLKIRLLN